MGALYKGVCYPLPADARKDHASQSTGVVLSGTTLYSTEVVSVGSTSFVLCTRTNGGTCTNRTMQAPDSIYPACDYNADASLMLDWTHAALWLFALLFGLKHLYELFSGRHDDK